MPAPPLLEKIELVLEPAPVSKEVKITAPKFDYTLRPDASKLLARHNLHNLDLIELDRIAYASGHKEYMDVLSRSPEIPSLSIDKGILAGPTHMMEDEVKNHLQSGSRIPVENTTIARHIPAVIVEELRQKDRMMKAMATSYVQLTKLYQEVRKALIVQTKESEEMLGLTTVECPFAEVKYPAMVGDPEDGRIQGPFFPEGLGQLEEIWKAQELF